MIRSVTRAQLASFVLAAAQAGDLLATQVSPRYSDDHLDHLGVPGWLRPKLPVIKLGAVLALLATRKRERWRGTLGAALVAYYSAAVTFHVLSRDAPQDIAPAAVCGMLAAVII